ncbi:MAG TPA: DUF4405 domain-containing protein [Methanoregula sp.]|nr:DUF4405 domain-containing protein [Methanoregula sp.]
MQRNVLKWSVDILMLVFFLISAITGLFKFTLLMRVFGLTTVVLPLAWMSDLHDWSGLALVILVLAHLLLNRRWLAAMTKKILAGKSTETVEE